MSREMYEIKRLHDYIQTLLRIAYDAEGNIMPFAELVGKLEAIDRAFPFATGAWTNKALNEKLAPFKLSIAEFRELMQNHGFLKSFKQGTEMYHTKNDVFSAQLAFASAFEMLMKDHFEKIRTSLESIADEYDKKHTFYYSLRQLWKKGVLKEIAAEAKALCVLLRQGATQQTIKESLQRIENKVEGTYSIKLKNMFWMIKGFICWFLGCPLPEESISSTYKKVRNVLDSHRNATPLCVYQTAQQQFNKKMQELERDLQPKTFKEELAVGEEDEIPMLRNKK